MKDVNELRVINDTEREIVVSSLLEISPKIQSLLENIDYELYISLNDPKQEYPAIYLVPDTLSEFITTQKLNYKIESAGIYFGFIKKGKFLISLEGSEFLYKSNSISQEQLMIVNNEGERSILYGNHIVKKMIVNLPNHLKKKDFIIVLNQSNDVISIAKSQRNYSSIQDLKENDIIALNLSDKGIYLRKKQ